MRHVPGRSPEAVFRRLGGSPPPHGGRCSPWVGSEAASVANEVGVLGMIGAAPQRQLEPPESVAELSSNEHAGFGERDEVSVDRGPVKRGGGEGDAELLVARRAGMMHERIKNRAPRLGSP
jgi:hypothetical protein